MEIKQNQNENEKWSYGQLENKILNVAIHDKSFFLILKENVLPSYFQNDIASKLYKIITKFYDKFNFIPTADILLTLSQKVFSSIEEKEAVLNLINFIYDNKAVLPNEKDFIINEIDNFIKKFKMKNAILKSVSLLEKNNYDEILKIIKDVVKFSSKIETGLKVSDEKAIDERYLQITDEFNIVPTFLNSLNIHLDGGLHRQEINIVMGASGFGKSTFLINQAVYALKKDYKVLYITLELNEKQICYRIDKCLWGLGTQEIKSNWKELKEKYNNLRKTLTNGDIVVYFAPAYSFTKSDLERLLEKLKNYEDFVPDLILIDYLELMQTTNYYAREREYERQGYITSELREIAVEHNCCVLTATQTNRRVFDLDNDKAKEPVGEQQVIGESYNKIKIADTFFLILQTKKESAEDMARLRIIKNRHGKINVDVPLIVDFNKMRIEEKII